MDHVIAISVMRSAEYVGMVLNNFSTSPGSTATATFEAGGAIFASEAYLPNADGLLADISSFPFVDISLAVDVLLENVRRS